MTSPPTTSVRRSFVRPAPLAYCRSRTARSVRRNGRRRRSHERRRSRRRSDEPCVATFVQRDDSLGVLVRKRPKRICVHETKKARDRRDSDYQRGQCHSSKTRRAFQRSERKSDVGPQVVDEHRGCPLLQTMHRSHTSAPLTAPSPSLPSEPMTRAHTTSMCCCMCMCCLCQLAEAPGARMQ